MLHFTTGDMFDVSVDVRINTVNCVGVMGAGVALAFKSRYPDMFREYKKACEAGDVRPGVLHIWRTLTDWVINFPTKRHWRENSRYEDIESGLQALRLYLDDLQRPVRVALPALGCGHGGLDWNRVSEMIRRYLSMPSAEIFVFEPADSVRIGESSSKQRVRQVATPTRSYSTNLRAQEIGFPIPLVELNIDTLEISGDGSLLSEPMLFVTLPKKPDPNEESAALQCVEALARAHSQLAFLASGTLWRRMVNVAMARGAKILLWSTQPLQEEVHHWRHAFKEDSITFVSVTAEDEAGTDAAYQRTQRAALQLATAVLITDSRPDWATDESVLQNRALFFIRYASTPTPVDFLQRRASPVGRSSKSRVPRIEPILAALFQHRNDQEYGDSARQEAAAELRHNVRRSDTDARRQKRSS